jgi:hypothetical protein
MGVWEVLRKGKAVPVTGHESPLGYETSWLPQFLENPLTDCGKIDIFARRPPFTFQDDFWYSFLLEAESNVGPQRGCKDWKHLITSSGLQPATFRLVA